ncbi:MAG: peptidoglycan DD-metalloendopeptidase family protein, partial [Acetatifactor sp.]
DLGDGYQATYGQLKDISVTLNSYIDAGEALGSVAAPTKYYSVEGSNLYFQLTKDGVAINPENMF